MAIQDLLSPLDSGYSQSRYEHYTLNFYYREFRKHVKIRHRTRQELSALIYNLGKPSKYTVTAKEGSSSNHTINGYFEKSHFNLVYLPKDALVEICAEGELLTFSIHFEPLYLKPLSSLFDKVSVFSMAEIEGKAPALLNPVSNVITGRIATLIKEVYHLTMAISDNTLGRLNLKGRIPEIILQSLMVQGVAFTELDPKLVAKARGYLRGYSPEPMTVARFVKVVGLTEDETQILKHDLVNQGKILLRDTNLSAEQIATSLGLSTSDF